MQLKLISAVIALAGGLIAAAPLAAAENPPVQKVFKQWQVTCNNLNDCDVRNLDEELRVIIKRQAGEQGKVSLAFQGMDGGQAEGIWLDGKALTTEITISPPEGDDLTAGATEDLAEIQQWVQASKNALKISLTPQGEGASLAGLNAALLLVDERQGRLNNQTALLRIGNNEPSVVPARPQPQKFTFPLPKVVALNNAQALIDGAIKTNAALLEKEYCEPNDENRQRSEAQPLNEKQALVLLNCGLGAYQSSSMLFISERSNPAHAVPLTLPLPLNDEKGQPQQVSWFTEGYYDPESATLGFSGRGRGIADCGDNASWKYDGKTFHLTSYNSQPSCRGGEPGDWPSVWASAESE